MQSNHLHQEHQSMQKQQPTLLVSALGFGATLEEKLKIILLSTRPDKPTYAWVSPTTAGIHVLLVNYDNPLALQKKDQLILGSCASAKIIAVSQGPLDNPPVYHIRGMLTASRLMAVLDKIPDSVAAPHTNLIPSRKLELVQTLVKTHEPVATVSNTNQYRALVVDDSAAIQKSLELKLATLAQIAGIDFADSGEAALAMAETNHYHLIFLDVMMPGIDGYETCTQLRKKPEYKKTPIIMVSGKTSPLDEVKGIMAGCTTYITKPVQDEAFQKLSGRVLAWLADRK